MNDTAAPLLEVVIPPAPPPAAPPLSKLDREHRAFLRLLPELLATHAGKYVAVHDERVVDSDDDDNALVLRVHRAVGYVPIFVGIVADPQPVGRSRRYRVVPPQEQPP